MNAKIVVSGKTEFMGKEVDLIEGGFGEGQRVITAHTIAMIHDMEVKEVNRIINDNLDEFEEGLDILNLLKVGSTHLEIKEMLGINLPPVTKNFYILSEQGYMALTSLLRTQKAKEIRREFRRHYFALRQKVKEMISATDQAILAIVQADNPVEQALAIKNYKETVEKPLIEEIDHLDRLLGDKMGIYSKKSLATKLDAKPQTMAARLKKCGVYTKTSQVSADFLKKFENITMIKDVEREYTNQKTNIKSSKMGWAWTYEGAKALIKYLIEIGEVKHSDNNGFKLVAAK